MPDSNMASANPTAVEAVPAPSDAETANQSGQPPRRRRWWLRIGLLLLVGLAVAGAWPAYRWWHERRTGQFKAACRAAVAAEDWQTLRSAASRWADWDPENGDAWVFLAEAGVQSGQAEQAAEALGRVRDDYTGVLPALAIRGDLLFSDLNRVYEAVETWQRMLRINPSADLARQRLIYFYAMTLQREKMLEHLRTAMKMHCEPPEAYAYYLLAYEVNFSDGLPLLTKWRQEYPDDETLEVAHAVYVAKYKPLEEIAVPTKLSIAPGDHGPINQCLTKYPANLEVLAFHLEKAVYEGDEEEVVRLLKQCPPAAERDGRFWRYRAWYLASQDRNEEAEAALRKALEIHPVDWRALWLLGGVLRQLGKTSEASEVSRVALQGKELRQKLFQLPNARALNERLFVEIHNYLHATAPRFAVEALKFRLDAESTAERRPLLGSPAIGPLKGLGKDSLLKPGGPSLQTPDARGSRMFAP